MTETEHSAQLPPPPLFRCGSCKHWIPPERRNDFKSIWKDDGETDKKYGICTLIELGDSYQDPPTPLPLAATKDGSDYRADLFTQPSFGCVLWEPRL